MDPGKAAFHGGLEVPGETAVAAKCMQTFVSLLEIVAIGLWTVLTVSRGTLPWAAH